MEDMTSIIVYGMLSLTTITCLYIGCTWLKYKQMIDDLDRVSSTNLVAHAA